MGAGPDEPRALPGPAVAGSGGAPCAARDPQPPPERDALAAGGDVRGRRRRDRPLAPSARARGGSAGPGGGGAGGGSSVGAARGTAGIEGARTGYETTILDWGHIRPPRQDAARESAHRASSPEPLPSSGRRALPHDPHGPARRPPVAARVRRGEAQADRHAEARA